MSTPSTVTQSLEDEALRMAKGIMGDPPNCDVDNFFHGRAVSWFHGFILHVLVLRQEDAAKPEAAE